MGLDNEDLALIRKGWDIVNRNQNKISSLVMDMLSFSKEREPDPVPSDLVALVTDIVETVEQRVAEIGATIRWSPPDDIPQLLFDPEALSRAILNVVTNAIDAVEERPNARVTIQVACDPVAQRVGVTVSRKILREHGGDIRVTSVLGEGSTFVLEFPLRTGDGGQTVSDFENNLGSP
jgi:hypothetical protein